MKLEANSKLAGTKVETNTEPGMDSNSNNNKVVVVFLTTLSFSFFY